MSVGVALVGAGAMGELVARRVYASPGQAFRLVAIVDDRPERGESLAAGLGIGAYPSLAQALAAREPIDAVDVRVPHAAHAPVALEAISHGLHVLVEKPIATSLADADALVDAARRHRVVAAVAENYPHLQALRAASDAIAAGALGAVRALRTTRAYTLEGVWLRDGWRTTGPSAGILLDQGTHHTSLLRMLGGAITSVSAVASRPSPAAGAGATGPAAERDTPAGTVLMTACLASGLAAQSLYTWDSAALQDEAEATVFGSEGRLVIRVDYEHALGGAFRVGPSGAEETALGPPENYYDSHRAIIEDWVARIGDGGRPVVTFSDGRDDLAVVLAAARSLAHDGRTVSTRDPREEADEHGLDRYAARSDA